MAASKPIDIRYLDMPIERFRTTLWIELGKSVNASSAKEFFMFVSPETDLSVSTDIHNFKDAIAQLVFQNATIPETPDYTLNSVYWALCSSDLHLGSAKRKLEALNLKDYVI